MFCKVSLICAAMLTVYTAQGSDTDYDKAVVEIAQKVKNKECPKLLMMFMNVSFYGDCMESKGYHMFESSVVCNNQTAFGSTPSNSTILTAINSCINQNSETYLCCLITEELKRKPGSKPQEKYDASEECIKEYYNKYGMGK